MQKSCQNPKEASILHHPFKPIVNASSKILILGSFPSVASREQNFYYSHPRNRFWQVLGKLFHSDLTTKNREEKIAFLLEHRIALYDICVECSIQNSSDESIKNPKLAPLKSLLQNTQIGHIFLNGKKAAQIYEKNFSSLPLPYTCLPSTSPANAKCNLEKLYQQWHKILVTSQS